MKTACKRTKDAEKPAFRELRDLLTAAASYSALLANAATECDDLRAGDFRDVRKHVTAALRIIEEINRD